jgi:hypothetical protein
MKVNDYDFGCAVLSIRYDFEKNTGHVYMPIGNCTDMEGTIKFFKLIDIHVGHIITWCNGELDTQYVHHADNSVDYKWIAI